MRTRPSTLAPTQPPPGPWRLPDAPPATDHALDALRAIESVSRRMEDLARELNCLGFFDDDDDRPRAA